MLEINDQDKRVLQGDRSLPGDEINHLINAIEYFSEENRNRELFLQISQHMLLATNSIDEDVSRSSVQVLYKIYKGLLDEFKVIYSGSSFTDDEGYRESNDRMVNIENNLSILSTNNLLKTVGSYVSGRAFFLVGSVSFFTCCANSFSANNSPNGFGLFPEGVSLFCSLTMAATLYLKCQIKRKLDLMRTYKDMRLINEPERSSKAEQDFSGNNFSQNP
ncbi:MAG: hypothetical protein ACE365_04040 [Gammaproteobacteria bacterium]